MMLTYCDCIRNGNVSNSKDQLDNISQRSCCFLSPQKLISDARLDSLKVEQVVDLLAGIVIFQHIELDLRLYQVGVFRVNIELHDIGHMEKPNL